MSRRIQPHDVRTSTKIQITHVKNAPNGKKNVTATIQTYHNNNSERRKQQNMHKTV